MGLDVVMIGLDEIKEQVKTDAQVAAMVKWLQENVPETHTTHIGQPSGRMSEGDRVGLYSDLHVLRGLALRFERIGASALQDATEEDLQGETDRFYEAEPPETTRFINLGSSEGLLEELDELAPILEMPGDRGSLSEKHFEQAVADHRWPTAAYVWGLLHWYARESVRAKTLIVFC